MCVYFMIIQLTQPKGYVWLCNPVKLFQGLKFITNISTDVDASFLFIALFNC